MSLGRRRSRTGKMAKNIEETKALKEQNKDFMKVELDARFGGPENIVADTTDSKIVVIFGVDVAVPRKELEKVIKKYNMRFKVLRKSFLMKRKASPNTRDILKRHPDIGEVMEKYATSCNVGADKWRRF